MILAVIQSSIIILLALCAMALLRRRSAAIRHAVLTAGLVASLATPIASRFLPAFEIVRVNRLDVLEKWIPEETAFELPSRNQAAALPQNGNNFKPPVIANRFIQHPIVWIWIGGMVVAAIILMGGIARVAWLLLRSKPCRCVEWVSVARDISQALRIRRPICLLQNSQAVLGTWGVLAPKVFVPRNADSWSTARIRVVLTHELAHIKRFDWPVQMLAEIARVVYWFNPLFWIVCRSLRLESEHACDDTVLNAGVDARDYAAHLLELARTLRTSDRSWSPVLAMSRPRNLERRFVAMLNPSLNHRPLTRATVLTIAAVVIGIALPVFAMRAPLPAELPAIAAPPAIVIAQSAPTQPTVAARVAPKPAAPAPGAPVAAQGLADGSASGNVYDPTGAVIPGVIVAVTSVDGRFEQQVATGDAGQFTFRALTPGLYLLTAQLPGFLTARARIEVKSSQISQQNLTLSVGNIAQRIVVAAVGQPKPATPPATPRRIRVGGYVQAANLINQVKPIYPENARVAGTDGVIHLQGIIGVDGGLVGLRVVGSNDPELAAAALESVRQWRYRPTLINNSPIEVITDIDVEFKLSQ